MRWCSIRGPSMPRRPPPKAMPAERGAAASSLGAEEPARDLAAAVGRVNLAKLARPARSGGSTPLPPTGLVAEMRAGLTSSPAWSAFCWLTTTAIRTSLPRPLGRRRPRLRALPRREPFLHQGPRATGCSSSFPPRSAIADRTRLVADALVRKAARDRPCRPFISSTLPAQPLIVTALIGCWCRCRSRSACCRGRPPPRKSCAPARLPCKASAAHPAAQTRIAKAIVLALAAGLSASRLIRRPHPFRPIAGQPALARAQGIEQQHKAPLWPHLHRQRIVAAAQRQRQPRRRWPNDLPHQPRRRGELSTVGSESLGRRAQLRRVSDRPCPNCRRRQCPPRRAARPQARRQAA